MTLTGEAVERWAREQAAIVEDAIRQPVEVRVAQVNPGLTRMAILSGPDGGLPVAEIEAWLQGDWQSPDLEYDPECGALLNVVLIRPRSRRRVWWSRRLFGETINIASPEQSLIHGYFEGRLAAELARYGLSLDAEE